MNTSNFKPDRLYDSTDPALLAVASEETLAQWRREGRGPEFIKLAEGDILYRGAKLNDWLDRAKGEGQ